ncbi:MAG: Rieske (2Fe-2S) protein [Bacteroidales bacterium]|nr:Rieske (2Fe-2S) protein [Bacteroidales bacterium]
MAKKTVWYKVLNSKDELPENRVTTVSAGHKQIALSHFEGKICALNNSCPHQGGPLGEGSIENGILRCPWHGWDYHPCTGKAPGFDDGVEAYKVKEENGAIFVGLLEEEPHRETISDVMMEELPLSPFPHR